MAQKLKKKYIENDAIDGSKLKLLENQAVRTVNSAGAVTDLIKLGPSDEVLVNGEQVALQSDLETEKIVRAAADNDLQSQINNLTSNLDPSALDSLTEIVAAFQSADSTINQAIAALGTGSTSALSQEILDRQLADASLQNQINTEINNRIGDVNAEEVRAIAAEGALQQSIDDEATLRANADDALQSIIDDEVNSRVAAILAEQTTRAAADTLLQDNIDAEQAARLAATTSITASITTEQAARIAGDTSLQNSILAEQTARTSADISLQDNISNEQAARIAGDTSLQASINAEITNRQSAITSVNSSVLAEQTARISADTSLQNSINAEIASIISAVSSEQAARIAADASLQSQIDYITSNFDTQKLDSLTEIVDAFQTADGDITTAINNLSSAAAANLALETSRATAAEGSLQSSINAEQSRAMAAEAAIESRLTNLSVVLWERYKVTVDQTIINNGYIDLPFLVLNGSMSATVDRLMIHEGASEDFTISTVDGMSRITLLNNLVDGGVESIAIGDNFYFQCQRETPLISSVWETEKITVDSNLINDCFLDLQYRTVDGSVQITIDRLMLHEGTQEDFTVSVNNGISRVTLLNDIVGSGNQSIALGDNIYIKYQRIS